MKIKKVAWRNMTSYGNKVQRIDFESNPGFYMLTGDNASGKSSFLACITFALYGKVANKNIKDLPNRKNKNAWVRIELQASGKSVIIERGIAPSIFEVTVDGVPIKEAGKDNVQKFLEDEIFKMPFYVFDNLISLNINDFKSFIDMSPSDKRAIIDRLFSLDVINQMREVLKSDVKEVKQVLDIATKEIEWIENSIQKSKDRMITALEKAKTETENEIASLNEQAEGIKIESDAASKEMEKIKAAKLKVSPKKQNLEEEIRNSKYTLEGKRKEIKFFDNDACPTCRRDIDAIFKEQSITRLQGEISEIENNMNERIELLEKVNESWEKLGVLESNTQDKIRGLQSNISTINTKIQWIKTNEKKSEDVDAISKMIEESEETLDIKHKERTKAESKSNYMKVLEIMLGEGGMKQLAIKNLLPMLNGYIAQLSKEMASDYEAVFNEEFDAMITNLGEEVSPKTLSTGETKKIDVIVLLSLIKLVKMRYPELNILFLDEVFSSVDHGNVYHVIRVLGKITKEMKLNTIVVNHSQLPHEEFDYILRTKKANGFSSIDLEKIN